MHVFRQPCLNSKEAKKKTPLIHQNVIYLLKDESKCETVISKHNSSIFICYQRDALSEE